MNAPAAPPLKTPIFYGWIVVGVTFAGLVTAAGALSLPTMFVQPFEEHFGWSASQIAAAQGLQIALFGLTGPFAAASFERYGVRRTVTVALLLLCAASLAITRVSAAWQLLPWAATVGIGCGLCSLTFGATIANRWFEKDRGVVLGLFSAGNATGQLVFLPLYGLLVQNAGWQYCALVVACVTVALIPLILFIVRERPVDVNLPRYGALEVEPAPAQRGNPLGNAFKTLRLASRTQIFWILSGSFIICGASTNGLVAAHFVPYCGDHGIPEVKAAGLLATMGAFDLIGTTLSGWLSDRYDARILLCAYYGLRGLSLLFLPFAFGAGIFGLPAFAAFYGLDWIATAPPTIKLATQSFGRERGPMVFGWIVAAHQLGAGTTAFGTGAVRTALGSYNDAFLTSGLLCLLGAALVLTIATKPRLQPGFAPAS